MSESYDRTSRGRAALREGERAGNGWAHDQGDMAGTLRALEDKLRALEDELASAETSPSAPAGEPSGGRDPGPRRLPPAAESQRPRRPPPAAESEPARRPPPEPFRSPEFVPRSPREPPPHPEPEPELEPELVRGSDAATPRAPEELTRIVSEASVRMKELRGQVDDLLRFRDQLRDSAQELIADYRNVLGGDRAGRDGDEFRGASGSPAAAPAPVHVLLDAGPFAELAPLAGVEQALARMPDVVDVHVRSLQDERAQIELTLSRPTALVDRMRTALPNSFRVIDVAPDRLTIDIES